VGWHMHRWRPSRCQNKHAGPDEKDLCKLCRLNSMLPSALPAKAQHELLLDCCSTQAVLSRLCCICSST
jgi:hypothetical protein